MRARLLLLGAGLAAFGGSLFAGFHLDDYAIFSGPLSRPFAWPHPVTHLLDWLNYQLAGPAPLGFHLVNLALHLGAVLLAYECLRRLLPAGAATLAAAVFAVHPLQAEAVNYVAARGAIVAALLGLAGLLGWIEGKRWIGAAAFAAAAIEMAPASARIGSYAYAVVALRFLRLLIVPWGFTAAPDVHEPMWLAIAAAIGIVALALWVFRRGVNLRSARAWLLIGLLLLIPPFPGNPAADPRAYLPLFAFAAAAGLLLERLPARPLAIAVVAILAGVSLSRTYVWMSDERLWREAVRRAPDRVEPKIQLSKWLRAGDALELLNRARQQAPYNPEIPAEIGKILLDEQQYDAAVEEFSRAVAMDPKNALAFNNRGVALAALGQTTAAQADFEHALALDPNLAEAHENLKRLSGK